MNDFLKQTIIETIKKGNVSLKREWGIDTYFVLDDAGKPLMEYVNGYDYGQYSLSVNHKSVANIEWYENAGKPLTKAQGDMFDILKVLIKRYTELQKLRKAQEEMSIQDKNLVNFLKGINTKVI